MRFVTKEQPTISNKLFTRAGVRYEVALDVLGAIIANYSEAIAAEHEKPTPDEADKNPAEGEEQAAHAARRTRP